VDRHYGAVILLDLLFTQSQVSHKGHIEVALNHPGVKVSEIGDGEKQKLGKQKAEMGGLKATV
jgi:hypothetical protein